MVDDNDTSKWTRRAVATAVGVGAAGVGISQMGGASAQVQTGVFDISDTSVETDAGLLEAISVSGVEVSAEYEGFNYAVDTVSFRLDVTHEGEGRTETVGTKTVPHSDQNPEDQSYTGSVTTTLGDFDLVSLFGQEAFEVEPDNPTESDDVTADFNVTFSLTATVTDIESNEVSDQATGNSLSTVTNLGTDVSVGGSADISVEEDTAGPRPEGSAIPDSGQTANGGVFWNTTGEDFALSAGDTLSELPQPGQPLYANPTDSTVTVTVTGAGAQVSFDLNPYSGDPLGEGDTSWYRIPTGAGTPTGGNVTLSAVNQTPDGFEVVWE